MNYMDENISCRDYIKLRSKPCLVSRSHFTINVKYTDNQKQKPRYLWPPVLGFQHCVIAFCSLSLLAEIQKKNFFKSLEKVNSPMQVKILVPHFQMWMPNSLGLWYTQMVFLFCISANVITKYNKFSSKVIRAHLASFPICPTCYLLITLWGDVVVLLLLWAKWPKG